MPPPYGFGYSIPNESFSYITRHFPKYATTLTSVDPSLPNNSSFSYETPASWYTIYEGETVEYVAHKKVILKNGFHAKAGSNFTARIETCTNCSTTRRMAKEYTNDEISIDNSNDINSSIIDDITKMNNENITIFPNPTKGDFIVKINNELFDNATLEIFNLNGHSIMKLLLDEQQQLITFKNAPGTYLIKIVNGKELHIAKIVLE